LNGHAVQPAVIQRSRIAVFRKEQVRVHPHSVIDHASVSRAKLELVGNQFMARGFLQELNLSGMHVAYTKSAHLTTGVKLVERC